MKQIILTLLLCLSFAFANITPTSFEPKTIYGGETIAIGTNTKNLSNVAQTCDLTMTATPSIATTEGELTTQIVKTISLEANAEQADVTTITFAADIEPGEYAIDMICNVVPTD